MLVNGLRRWTTETSCYFKTSGKTCINRRARSSVRGRATFSLDYTYLPLFKSHLPCPYLCPRNKQFGFTTPADTWRQTNSQKNTPTVGKLLVDQRKQHLQQRSSPRELLTNLSNQGGPEDPGRLQSIDRGGGIDYTIGKGCNKQKYENRGEA